MKILVVCLLAFFTFAGAPVFSEGNDRYVTTLNDDGPGSFRQAVKKNGPAKVIFKISGDILLSRPLEVIGDNLIIDVAASEKADGNLPTKGIRLIGFGILVSGSSFQLSNLRVWVGDKHKDPNDSPDQDGILIRGTKEKPVTNGTISNCTVFAAVDEGISTYGPVANVAIRENMIIWGLSHSHHQDIVSSSEPDPERNHHSMAILISEGANNVLMERNLLALNRHRNPRVMPGSSVGFVNNVVYGWGKGVDDGLYFAAKE